MTAVFDVSYLFYDLSPRCSSSAKTILSELTSTLSNISHLSEFTSSWRRENARSGVVYRTSTVLGLQIIHSLCLAQIIILFLKAPSSSFRVVDLKSLSYTVNGKCTRNSAIYINYTFKHDCYYYYYYQYYYYQYYYFLPIFLNDISYNNISYSW